MRRRTGRGQGGFAPPRRPPPIPRKALRSPGPCVSRGGFRAPRPPVYAPAPGFGACVCACALVWLARVRPLPACAGGALRAPRGGCRPLRGLYKTLPVFCPIATRLQGGGAPTKFVFCMVPPLAAWSGGAKPTKLGAQPTAVRRGAAHRAAPRLVRCVPPCEQCRLCQAPFGA